MPYVLLRQRGAAGQVDADLQAIVLFAGFAVLSMVIIAGVPVVLGEQVARGAGLTARWPLLAIIVVASIAASWGGNLSAYQAEVLSRRSSEAGSRSELSVQLARRAVEVSPSLDRPALLLGQASLRHAVTLTDPGRREMVFVGAEAALLRARAINPFNPDHTMMLASLHRVWSDLAVEPVERERHTARVGDFCEQTIRMSPNAAHFYGHFGQMCGGEEGTEE
jgi:hypothetical protein